jgi:hypothetical protein
MEFTPLKLIPDGILVKPLKYNRYNPRVIRTKEKLTGMKRIQGIRSFFIPCILFIPVSSFNPRAV